MSGRRPARLPTLGAELTRSQLTISAVAVLFAALAVLAAGITTMGVYARTNLRLIARTASYSVAPAIVFADTAAARASVAPLVSTAGVARIEVNDQTGRTVVTLTNNREDSGAPLSQLVEKLFLSEPESAPIEHQGQVIGAVRVTGHGDLVARYIWLGLAGMAASLIPALLATLWVARRLQARIVQPLRSIADVAHAVRIDRDFERRAEPAALEEIEGLRTDFNALIGELHDWQQRLTSENEALSYRAHHDPLTKLPNRTHFETRLSEKLDQASAAGQMFAFFYADGDGFKDINDRYGHSAGDAVLIETAKRLRATVRTTDVVARLGGDEFAFLLGPPFSVDGIAHVHMVVDEAMAQPFDLPSGDRVSLSLSLGSAIYPDDGLTARDLMHCADTSMYEVKTSARRFRGKSRNAADDGE